MQESGNFQSLSEIQTFCLTKLSEFSSKLDDLSSNELLISNPDYTSEKFIQLSQELSQTQHIVSICKNIIQLIDQIKQSEELLAGNDELADLAKSEITDNELKIQSEFKELQILTAKKLEDDDEYSIIEIRPGVGGAEASLFAHDLFMMYTKYMTSQSIKYEVMNIDYSELGGISEVSLIVKEKGAFGRFRFEAGVHRVQRVPSTESSGRIHTSTASVVVMPQIENPDIKIDPNDIRVDVFRAGGPGGQSVNTTDSAVRITHIPTGIIVTSQNTKSQHQNKETAMKVLQNKLLQIQKDEIANKLGKIRNEHISGGDRSAKIRTYNFQQSRITDHRVGKSWFNITEIMAGGIDELIAEENLYFREESIE